MRVEPRFVFAAPIDIGDHAHLVAVDFAFEHRDFVNGES